VVWRRCRQDGSPETRTPLLPMQPVKRHATYTVKRGEARDGLESGQLQAHADHWASFNRTVRPSCDRLPGGYRSREVPAQIEDDMV
jgi:hypothetical protein